MKRILSRGAVSSCARLFSAALMSILDRQPVGHLLRWVALLVTTGAAVASAQTYSAITSVTRTSGASIAQDSVVSYTVGFTAGSDRVQGVVVTLIGVPSLTQRQLEVTFAPSTGGSVVLSGTTTTAWPVGEYVVANVALTDEANRNIQFRPDGEIARFPAIAGAPSTHSLNYYNTQRFQLTVSPASLLPKITVQPQSQSVSLRGVVSFFVAASGPGVISYQWAKNGIPIPGATGESLVISGVQNTDAGNYTVVATNSQGSTTSNVAVLTVNPLNQAPIFVQQPENASANDGASFTVDVRVQLPDKSEVTWKANAGGRSLTGVVVSNSRNSNDVLTATLSFGSVTSNDAGLFQVVASNVFGSTLSQARILTVNPVAPSITTQPRDQAVEADESVTLTVAATGTGPLSYRWRKNATDISGATSASYTITRAQTSDAGSYTVVVTNRVGSVETSAATVTVAAAVAPAIATQPASQSARVGSAITLTVAARSTRPMNYQWYKNGTAIPGATSTELVLASVTAADAGHYTVVVTNTLGTVQSSLATLSIVVPEPARLVNLSLLTPLAASESFTLGFVVGGDAARAAKPMLIRAGGPSLVQFGVANPHGDPVLELFAGQEKMDQNNDWGGGSALSATFTSVGAYPYVSADSKDAALVGTRIPSGGNSVRVSGSGSTSGVVLAELYETTPAQEMTSASPRLINVSVMKGVGSGMTVGFVIGGTGSKTVLARAIGPGLAGFGVTGFVPDPALTLFAASGSVLRSNDNWDPASATTMQAVGAFALAANSRDAALVATLSPGSYTLQVAGVDGATGAVLVEIYEVP